MSEEIIESQVVETPPGEPQPPLTLEEFENRLRECGAMEGLDAAGLTPEEILPVANMLRANPGMKFNVDLVKVEE